MGGMPSATVSAAQRAMTTASSTPDTRQRLLAQGLTLASKVGLRGLSVRGLCQAAGINTGSFVYHFGNRERFAAELIEHWYAPLLGQLQLEFDQQGPPVQRLQAMMRQLMAHFVAHRALISQIVLDAAAGEAAVVGFMRSLGPRHPLLLLKCIEQAQKDRSLMRADPAHQMLFLMASVGLPVVLQGLMAGRRMLPDMFHQAMAAHAADPASLEQRLQWALQGLRPPE